MTEISVSAGSLSISIVCEMSRQTHAAAIFNIYQKGNELTLTLWLKQYLKYQIDFKANVGDCFDVSLACRIDCMSR